MVFLLTLLAFISFYPNVFSTHLILPKYNTIQYNTRVSLLAFLYSFIPSFLNSLLHTAITWPHSYQLRYRREERLMRYRIDGRPTSSRRPSQEWRKFVCTRRRGRIIKLREQSVHPYNPPSRKTKSEVPPSFEGTLNANECPQVELRQDRNLED